jgi:hypothetical protein
MQSSHNPRPTGLYCKVYAIKEKCRSWKDASYILLYGLKRRKLTMFLRFKLWHTYSMFVTLAGRAFFYECSCVCVCVFVCLCVFVQVCSCTFCFFTFMHTNTHSRCIPIPSNLWEVQRFSPSLVFSVFLHHALGSIHTTSSPYRVPSLSLARLCLTVWVVSSHVDN